MKDQELRPSTIGSRLYFCRVTCGTFPDSVKTPLTSCIQPFSINFVPDVLPVFTGVARVSEGGRICTTCSGTIRIRRPSIPDDYDPVRGYSSNSIYSDGEVDVVAIYGTDTWGVEGEDGSKIEVPGPREFRHTMPTFINGLIASGFEILAFSEHTTWEEDPEPGSWEHFKAVQPAVSGLLDQEESRRRSMITLVEALNFRCLRYISRQLGSFHVLVGPNASGKTTSLDVVSFLQELVSEGLEAALENRTSNPQELLFRRGGDRLELAVEASIPEDLRLLTARPDLTTARYEVSIGFDETERQFEFRSEQFLLKKDSKPGPEPMRSLFPESFCSPDTLVTPRHERDKRMVVSKVCRRK